jgi:hypothetical protein
VPLVFVTARSLHCCGGLFNFNYSVPFPEGFKLKDSDLFLRRLQFANFGYLYSQLTLQFEEVLDSRLGRSVPRVLQFFSGFFGIRLEEITD